MGCLHSLVYILERTLDSFISTTLLFPIKSRSLCFCPATNTSKPLFSPPPRPHHPTIQEVGIRRKEMNTTLQFVASSAQQAAATLDYTGRKTVDYYPSYHFPRFVLFPPLPPSHYLFYSLSGSTRNKGGWN